MITAINPITFTGDVFSGYTEFLTDFISFKDKSLMDQFKREIAFDLVSGSRIIKGPYVKLNRPFLTGHSLREMAPQYNIPKILYDKFPFPLYKHQQDAFEHLSAGHNLVVSTGTGSGKTEAFLIPIIARLLNLQHEGKLKGLHAILVYPMNALANDQLTRLRKILTGTGITFGRYTGETKRGKTPDDVRVLLPGTQKVSETDQTAMEYGTLVPSEEMLTRDQIQQTPPNILITNYMQLEYLLLRGKDIPIFDSAPVEYVVMDEMHTYIGEQGSEVAALLRRLKCLCADPERIRFVGTSATVASGSLEEMTRSVSRFASRLFGVTEASVKCVFEQFKAFDKLSTEKPALDKPKPTVAVAEMLSKLVNLSSLDRDEIDSGQLYELYRQLSGFNGIDEACHDSFMNNAIVVDLMIKYIKPSLVSNAIATIQSLRPDVSDEEALAEVYCYLLLGLLLHDNEEEPLLRPNLHFFFKGVHDLKMSYENGKRVLSLNASTRRVSFDLYNCRVCGMHYLKGEYEAGLDDGDCPYYELSTDPESSRSMYFTDNSDFIADDDKQPYKLCEDCGTLHFGEQVRECKVCRSRGLIEVYMMDYSDRTLRCCSCGTKLGDAQDGEKGRNLIQAASREPVDLTIALENMLANATHPKAIVFVDNRQEAAFLSGYLKVASRRFVLRDRLHSFFEQTEEFYSLSELPERFYEYLCDIGDLIPPKAKGKRKIYDSEEYTQIEWFLHEEFCSDVRTIKRRSLEKLGLLKVAYDGINLDEVCHEAYRAFLENWSESLDCSQAAVQAYCLLLLDYLRSHS
ncbi:MAG: DEAD/DEAH box helicase, partial [Thermotogota bacterium]